MTLTLKSFLGVLFLSVFSSLSSAQIISTIAGNGTPGNSGDGGQALSASVYGNDIAADGAGNVYFVTDLTIRKVSSTGLITTLAGNGTSGTGGDGGLAVNAQFLIPRGIGADVAGNVYICDGNRVRKISTSGIITTIAGSTVSGNTGDGGQATAALLNAPADVAVDGIGNVYIADRNNNCVRKITATSGVITYAVGGGIISHVAVNTAGVIYFVDGVNSIKRFNGVSTSQLSMGYPAQPWGPDGVVAWFNGYATIQGLAVDDVGNIFFTANNRVRILTSPALYHIYTYAGNGTATFGGDGGVAYMANLNDPKGVTVQGSTLYISDKGNYRVRKVNGCTSGPTVPGAITGPAIFCPGSTYTYSVPVSTDGFCYKWTFPPGWTTVGAIYLNTITVTAGSSAGTVSVQCYNTCGFGTAQNLVVSSVIPEPTFTPSPFAQHTLCPGATMQLSVSPAPNINVQWKKDGVAIPGATSTTYTANSLGFYTVQQTHTSGCSGNTTFGVNIVAPTADVYSYPWSINSFCAGDSLLLIAESNTSDNISGYQWQNNGVSIPNTNNDSVFVKQSGDYTALVTAGCPILSQAFSVIMMDTPTYTITSSSPTFCPGQASVTLTMNTTASNVDWYLNSTLVDNDNIYYAPLPGLYHAIAQSSNGCSSSGYFDLVWTPVSANISYPDGIVSCNGEGKILHVDTSPASSYQWYFDGTLIPGATGTSYFATVSGTYAVSVTNTICGTYNNNTGVFIDSIGPVQLDGPVAFCIGDDVELSVVDFIGHDYQWFHNGILIPGAIDPVYTANTSGDYFAVITNMQCFDTSATIFVSVTPPPTPTITQSGNDLSVPSGFISYQWYLNGTAISGANSETYTATQDGDYYVVVSDGCEGQSNTVNLFLSVGDVNGSGSSIVVRPNPFSDFAVLTFDNEQRVSHSFKVYNVQGQLVQDLRNITTGELKIERGILSAGIYYFQLHNDKGVVGKGKLIIQ